MQDLLNFQYSLFCMRKRYTDDMVDIYLREGGGGENFSFLAPTEKPVGFDLERHTFVGPWRDERNPLGIETSEMSCESSSGGNPIGALKFELSLEPGEAKEINFIAGMGRASEIGREARERYSQPGAVEEELAKLAAYYGDRLGAMKAETPDEDFNRMANIWHPLQAHTTFRWSRSASLIEAGGRSGYGFRDSLQDAVS